MPLVAESRIIKSLRQNPEIIEKIDSQVPHGHKISFKTVVKLVSNMRSLQNMVTKKERIIIKASENYKHQIGKYEENAMRLEPIVENRIICIQNEQVITN